ncbi:MAG TPA: TIGR03620 family F420-dependent LLM class oxidoreductase, partial [Myxococcota bacterium]|nr:TIGR03620 family F420-dependent LLM class oxidoreductase [Myxococcota bacterium]
WLLAKTERLIVATGIANIYARDPAASASAQKTLAEQSNGRFLLGLGVSHRPLVEGVRGHVYASPVKTMRAYLERMQKSPYTAPQPAEPPPTVLAALGPQMLKLAATVTQGAHPYFTTPEHTAMARAKMGPDAWLCVEQKVLLESDPQKARALGRGAAAIYLGLENYCNNWKRLGFTDSDLANGGSDAFIDATIAWGDAGAIQKRIRAHQDAGASHVCIQPINPAGVPLPDWRVLEALAPRR